MDQLREKLNSFEILLRERINRDFLSGLAEKNEVVFLLDSFLSSEVRKVFQEMRQLVKGLPSNVILIAGGAHPSGEPLGTLKMGFDYLVIGEGEETLQELISTLILCPNSVSGIEGVARVLNGSKLDYRPRKLRVNLDDYKPYVTHPRSLHPPIEIARGCPFGCKFCQVSYLFGYRPRYRSLDSIDRIVEHYCKQFLNHVQIRLIAPNLLGYGSKTGRKPDIGAVRTLVRTIKSHDVELFAGTFPSPIRPEFLSRELSQILAENVVNRRVSMGVQSGSQQILSSVCRRGYSSSLSILDDVSKAHEVLEDVGMKSSPDFIFGFPEETAEDQWKTLDFMKSLIKLYDARPRIHHFIPLPGTPLAGREPASINSEVWKEMCELTRQDLADGHFHSQQKLAREILQLIDKSQTLDLGRLKPS